MNTYFTADMLSPSDRAAELSGQIETARRILAASVRRGEPDATVDHKAEVLSRLLAKRAGGAA